MLETKNLITKLRIVDVKDLDEKGTEMEAQERKKRTRYFEWEIWKNNMAKVFMGNTKYREVIDWVL